MEPAKVITMTCGSSTNDKKTCGNCGKILEERDRLAYGGRCENCWVGNLPAISTGIRRCQPVPWNLNKKDQAS